MIFQSLHHLVNEDKRHYSSTKDEELLFRQISELGTCANQFLVPENPQVPKSANLEKKFFSEIESQMAPLL
jgi:hypothetical protein